MSTSVPDDPTVTTETPAPSTEQPTSTKSPEELLADVRLKYTALGTAKSAATTSAIALEQTKERAFKSISDAQENADADAALASKAHDELGTAIDALEAALDVMKA